MTERQLLDQAISLLCGAPSGFTRGTQLDCEWENHKAALLNNYRTLRAADGESTIPNKED